MFHLELWLCEFWMTICVMSGFLLYGNQGKWNIKVFDVSKSWFLVWYILMEVPRVNTTLPCVEETSQIVVVVVVEDRITRIARSSWWHIFAFEKQSSLVAIVIMSQEQRRSAGVVMKQQSLLTEEVGVDGRGNTISDSSRCSFPVFLFWPKPKPRWGSSLIFF